MNTTKALIISAVSLVFIFAMQIFIRCHEVFGVSVLESDLVVLLHSLSGFLAIVILTAWCCRHIFKESRTFVGGSISLSSNDSGTLDFEPEPVPAPQPMPVAPEPYTQMSMDVLRFIIELSDGRTRSAFKMRTDGAGEVRVSMGSSRNCNILIKDRTVAQHHADLIIKGSRIEVYNVGHNNGVAIGRNKVEAKTKVLYTRGAKLMMGGVTITIS